VIKPIISWHEYIFRQEFLCTEPSFLDKDTDSKGSIMTDEINDCRLKNVNSLMGSHNECVRMFHAYCFSTYSQECSHKNGYISETECCSSKGKMDKSRESLQEILKDFAEYCQIDRDSEHWQFLRDSKTTGRLVYSCLEGKQGNPLSQQEREQWERGKLKALFRSRVCYIVCYVMQKDEITDNEIFESMNHMSLNTGMAMNKV